MFSGLRVMKGNIEIMTISSNYNFSTGRQIFIKSKWEKDGCVQSILNWLNLVIPNTPQIKIANNQFNTLITSPDLTIRLYLERMLNSPISWMRHLIEGKEEWSDSNIQSNVTLS